MRPDSPVAVASMQVQIAGVIPRIVSAACNKGGVDAPLLLTQSRSRDLAGSLALDVRRLDDRPPFFDLGFVKGGKRLRRLVFSRRNFLAEIKELGTHHRIVESLNDCSIELGDNFLRGTMGNPKCTPIRRIETR